MLYLHDLDFIPSMPLSSLGCICHPERVLVILSASEGSVKQKTQTDNIQNV